LDCGQAGRPHDHLWIGFDGQHDIQPKSWIVYLIPLKSCVVFIVPPAARERAFDLFASLDLVDYDFGGLDFTANEAKFAMAMQARPLLFAGAVLVLR